MMTAITIMADKLDRELQERGIFGVGRDDCLRIVRDMIDHASEVAEQAPTVETSDMGKPV
jgi:hypothetical protein